MRSIHRYARVLAGLSWALVVSLAAAAQPLAPEDVPFSLKPWVKWVLAADPQHGCPFLFNNNSERRCGWPTPLRLNLDDRGGQFSLGWQVYVPAWVGLPGDAEHWPQDVIIDGNAAAVTERGGRPAIWVEPGSYQIEGRFDWMRMPEALWLPSDVGLIQLTVNGVPKLFPTVNEAGRLWLAAGGDADAGATDNDSLALQVYRLVTDEIPLQMSTRIELDVAGRQREVVLPGSVLKDFIPLSLASALPARLEPDGGLRLQLRPGHWSIDVVSRHPRDLTAIALPEAVEPWPASELWSFAARNHLRLVDVQGVAQIDPNQTTLPAEWQSFPAYRVSAGETMQLNVNRRGDPQPEPDRLSLNRQLWLDFEGGGYTFSDTLGGTITTGWRLEANPPMQLGRVAVDGQPQLITRASGAEKSGVEVRRGSVNVNADGRYEGNVRSLPAVGWDHDFQQASATLHLPPGWRLLSVSGVDDKRASGAWLYRWTLLDLFLVLIAAVAIARLWDKTAALLALVTLALIWFEPGAPRYVWLNLIAAIALLRVLPAGRLRTLVSLYRGIVAIALVLIAVPFFVNQVRTGLFPQLEYPWRSVAITPATPAAAPVPEAAMAPAPADAPVLSMEAPAEMEAERMAEPVTQGELKGRALRKMMPDSASDLSGIAGGYQSQNYREVDPKANVQTGPGLPRWGWTDVPLNWHGSVQRDQQVHLLLLSPRQHLLLNLLRVLLVTLLAAALLRASLPAWRRSTTAAMLALPFAAALLMTLPRPVQAQDYPSQDLLNELRTRLTTAPACLPACAQSPRLRLDVQGELLQLRLEIHASVAVAVPLPGAASHWLPTEVSVDGEPATELVRTPAGELWLAVTPGAHQIVLAGPLPSRASVQLPLPLTPRRVEIEQTGDWRVDGVREDGTSDAQLLLTRAAASGETSALDDSQPSTLPTFARVERTLQLGLEWRVQTRVVRLSAPDSAIVFEVPLLPGESITTENVRVVDGKAQINMSAQNTEQVFDSVLEKTAEITLTAPETTAWTEVWRADVSPVLHAGMSGIPVVHHQTTAGNWLPEWRPWPGESVTLAISRPEGVAGNTLTIDASHLAFTPGERATDVTLTLDVRSSQGGQHSITLPEGALLQSATINGVAQPIRQQERLVTLPITPGAQNVVLNWREPQGISNRYRSSPTDLSVASVNSNLQVHMPVDRWVLFTRGPLLGPAVMFWGELIVIVLIAAVLARVPLTPLGFRQWLLLGIGLSQVPIVMGLVVAGWLLALGWRARWPADVSTWRFNLGQIALTALTLAALYCLYAAIHQGLLGMPDMQIAGNQSSAQQLNWYQDHAAALLPQAMIVSVPLIVYHLLMLAWALWLAFALVRWLRWGWRGYSSNGLWRPFNLFTRRDRVAPEPPPAAS